MGCGGGGGGRGLARSGSHPSGRLFLMYPATCAKCASVASHIDPVKLRTSLVYSEIYTYVSESQVKYPRCTYHAQNLLIITRHIAKERESVYMLKDAPVFAMLRVFKGCLRRSSPVRKCTTSSTDSRNDLHKRHQTRLRKVAFCATLSANVSNISIHLAPNMRACSPCRGIALHLV